MTVSGSGPVIKASPVTFPPLGFVHTFIFPMAHPQCLANFSGGSERVLCKSIVLKQKGNKDQGEVSQAGEPEHSNTCLHLPVLCKL